MTSRSRANGRRDRYTLFGGGSGMLAAAQGLPLRMFIAPKFDDMTWWRGRNSVRRQLRGKKIGVAAFPAAFIPPLAPAVGGGLDPERMW